ncbi:MAG: VOC family protein [Nitratireductor sp.]
MNDQLPMPAISLITLGVEDLAVSLAFYRALGFRDTTASQDSVKFLNAGNIVLGLFARDELARDAHVDNQPTGFAAQSLAMNLPDEASTEAMFARAIAAGGTELKQPQKVFWGGYSGYFADPDGHLWEVAHNPFFEMDANGTLRLESKSQ